MDKARLAWIMSGLTQYELTKAEEAFLKTVSADFNRSQALTEKQEQRVEALYKLKSQLIPNKYRPTPKESPKKAKPWKHSWQKVP